MSHAAKLNLLGLTRAELEAFFVSLGEKPFRASQMMQWIHHFGCGNGFDKFDGMTNFSKELRAKLGELATVAVPQTVLDKTATDLTRKWVLRLDQGNDIETVFIPETSRGTLCISSQVGCALACSFCSTAQQGFNRNLSTAEIISQVWLANKSLGRDPKGERIITNVVLMGMGEPLLNIDNVIKAMSIMQDDFAYGLSKRRITLSTSGVVPALERLRDLTDVSLAVSLHAPNDALRDQLVPLNKKYPIRQLLQACRQYLEVDGRRKITFEYVMLAGVNDRLEHARQLAVLLRPLPAKVNLIPFNHFPGSDYRCSAPETIERFRQILVQAGLVTTIRKTRGDNIDAACGQLVGKVLDKTKRTRQLPVTLEREARHG